MARLFLAVWPPDEVVEILRALPRKDQRGVRFTAPETWHATLRFFGEASIDDVVEALDGADATPLPGAHARVGPAIDMLGTHSVIAPVHGLDDLAAAVVSATAGIGSLAPRRRYTGHVTIARVRNGAVVRNVIGLPCAATFEVTEVALVESRLRPTGAEYQTVATWLTS